MIRGKYLLAFLMFLCLMTLLGGCLTTTTLTEVTVPSTTTTLGSFVPDYEGMRISDSRLTLLVDTVTYRYRLWEVNAGGTPITTDIDDPIDQEHPFGTEFDRQIEAFLFHSYYLPPTDSMSFYAEPNQTLYLAVYLTNPDHFSIHSFDLNDVTYTSDDFEEGSGPKQVIVKVESGAVSGVKPFTIENIQYLESGILKPVHMDGEPTIQLGVTYLHGFEVSVGEVSADATSISWEATIVDSYALVSSAVMQLNAVLFDGESLVRFKSLSVGVNTILFNNLIPNKLYQCAIIATYDKLDGVGQRIVVVDKVALYTEDILAIENPITTKESIAFTLTTNDPHVFGSIDYIDLFLGDELVSSLSDLSVREFSGLLSNTHYTIRVIYSYEFPDSGVIRHFIALLEVSTLSNATPTVSIDEVVVTRNSLQFSLTLTDEDHIGRITSVNLYQGDDFVRSLTLGNDGEFTGLLPSTEYSIRVTVSYDLNDGQGEQTLVVSESYTTLS